MKRLCRRAALLTLSLLTPAVLPAQHPNQIVWALKYDPKTFDPAKVDDQASETVRFLTGGVLLRLNRLTMAVEPALAERWQIAPDGRLITLVLRKGLRFSDGSPLTSADVVWSLRRVFDPATAAPVAEEFGPGVTVDAADPLTVRVHLPRRVAGVASFFDEVAIEPANRRGLARITSGPFTLADFRRGESLELKRNPYYWRHDAAGVALPYLDSIRLDIVSNPEQIELRFLRGQYQLLESVAPQDFNALKAKMPEAVRDFGPSLNTEQMWFNQSAAEPLPDYEKAWFESRGFRLAIAEALHRADLARIAYDGHATPAAGFISPSNRFWHDPHVTPVPENVQAAQDLLAKEGFRRVAGKLVDRAGHPVRFSLLTNAGNRARERMAALIQQDLAAIGIEVNLVTLDFPAMSERLTHTGNYEAALLGLSNVQPDPSTMENIWLSSSPTHQWNPSEKVPATPWEAELDRLMATQSSAATDAERKRAVDRVQEIVAEQQPFIYLVYPNALYAVSPRLQGVILTPLQPGVISNIDAIRWKASAH